MLNPEQISNISSIKGFDYEQGFGLTPGDDQEASAFASVINMRLLQDRHNRFLKLRGGTSSLKTLVEQAIKIHGFKTLINGVTKSYVAYQNDSGNVGIYNITDDTLTNLGSGFSTAPSVQFVVNGVFIYFFDRLNSKSTFYNIKDDVYTDFLNYEKSTVTNALWEDTESLSAVPQNVFGFKENTKIIVFPNGYRESDTPVSLSGVLSYTQFATRVFRYVYNGGKYIVDADGLRYDSTRMIVIGKNERFNYSIEGNGVDPEIYSIGITLKSDDVYQKSFVATIKRITGNSIVFDPDDETIDPYKNIIQFNSEPNNSGVQVGGMEAIPFNSYLQKAYVGKSAKYKVDLGSIEINPDYIEPTIHKGYLVAEQLADGSAKIPGRPYTMSLRIQDIYSNTETVRIRVFISYGSANNSSFKFLCSTRWLPTEDMVHDPSTEEFSNSAFFVNSALESNSSFYIDSKDDQKLIQPISSVLPMDGGIVNFFGPGEFLPKNIAEFDGSVMFAGYGINRPQPIPYNASVLNKNGNIAYRSSTSFNLTKDVTLGFLFQYTDGAYSNYVQTSKRLLSGTQQLFLRKSYGSILLQSAAEPVGGATSASGSVKITKGNTSTGDITVTHDGVTLTITISAIADRDTLGGTIASNVTGSHAGLNCVYNEINKTLNFQSVSTGSTQNGLDVTINANAINAEFEDISSYAVVYMSGAVGGVSGKQGDLEFTVEGAGSFSYEVQYGDSKEDIADGLLTSFAPSISGYTASKIVDGGSVSILIESSLPGQSYNANLYESVNTADIINTPKNIQGGSDGLSLSANLVQIHSLNALVKKIYVIGAYNDTITTTYHVLHEADISDPEAHGKRIELPHTDGGLDEFLSDTFTIPTGNDILTSVDADNYVAFGAPYQFVSLKSQKKIDQYSIIQRAVALTIDVDRTTIRYRVLVFTDSGIQLGFINQNGDVYDANFTQIKQGVVINSPEQVAKIDGTVWFVSGRKLYTFNGGETNPALDLERYFNTNSVGITGIQFNNQFNEIWFITGTGLVIIYDKTFRAFRTFTYSSASISSITSIDKQLVGVIGNALCYLDKQDANDDLSTAFKGEIITTHIGNDYIQKRLLDTIVYGSGANVAVDVDAQEFRFYDSSENFNNSFQNSLSISSAQINFSGTFYQIKLRAKKPRIKYTISPIGNVSDVVIEHIKLRTVSIADQGSAIKSGE